LLGAPWAGLLKLLRCAGSENARLQILERVLRLSVDDNCSAAIHLRNRRLSGYLAVSRLWNTIATLVRDEVAVISKGKQADRLLNKLRTDPTLRHRTRQLFVEWLDGSAIPPSVYINRQLPPGSVTAQHLADLAAVLANADDYDGDDDDDGRRRFNGIDVFGICELFMCTVLRQSPELLLPLLPRLRHLEITGVAFSLRYPWENVAKILPALTRLRSIHIYAAEAERDPTPPETVDDDDDDDSPAENIENGDDVDAPFSLVEARFDSCTLLRADSWLSIFRNSTTTLRRLTLSGCDFTRNVLELVGPNLEELCLTEANDELDANVGPILLTCKRLRRLSLGQRFAPPNITSFIDAPVVELSLSPLYPWTSLDIIDPLKDGLVPSLQTLQFTPPSMVISPGSDWDDDDRRAVETVCEERGVQLYWMM
jgi:hypothetical protein